MFLCPPFPDPNRVNKSTLKSQQSRKPTFTHFHKSSVNFCPSYLRNCYHQQWIPQSEERTIRCPLPKTWKYNFRNIYLENWTWRLFVQPVWNPKRKFAWLCIQSIKMQEKNVAESFTRFSNMTGICKIPWSLICVSTFPPKNHKSRILPPEHAKSATYCVTRRIWTLIKIFWRIPSS